METPRQGDLTLIASSAFELMDASARVRTTALALIDSMVEQNEEAVEQLTAHYYKKQQEIVGAIVAIMRRLDDEQKKEIIFSFCRTCGSNNSRCQCWNDE